MVETSIGSARAAAPATSSNRQDLVKWLERRRGRLSPVQRRLADYVLRNYREAGFMNVVELASAAGVSPSAVVRFAVSLGFDGYPDLQRALHGIIRTELRQASRFSAALAVDGREPLYERVLAQELQNVETLRANLDRAALDRAVTALVAARTVAVVGFRAATPLAQYLWYDLRKVKPDVRLYTAPGSVTQEEIALADRSTVIVLLTFPRYSRELLDVAEVARRAGLFCIGVTDNELSPLVPLCRTSLLVEVRELSFTDFHAAPVALINAVVAEVARRLRPRALRRLNRLDDFAAQRGYLFPTRRARAAR